MDIDLEMDQGHAKDGEPDAEIEEDAEEANGEDDDDDMFDMFATDAAPKKKKAKKVKVKTSVGLRYLCSTINLMGTYNRSLLHQL
jgi:hypothetical protein